MTITPVDLPIPPRFVPGGKAARDALRRATYLMKGPSVSVTDVASSPATIFKAPKNTFIDEIFAVKDVVQNGTASSDAATISVGDSDNASFFLPAVTLNFSDTGTTSSKDAASSDAPGSKGFLYTTARNILATITVPTADAASDNATAGTVTFYCRYRSFDDEL